MNRITAAQLAAAVGMGEESAVLWVSAVNEAAQDCGLNTPARWALWLAQCGHESQSFRKLGESFDYSPQRLLAVFPRYFTPELAERLGRTAKQPAQQKEIAEVVYGGRMGNRPGSGDAWAFRGGGLPHLTGRNNYTAAGNHLGLDLLTDPDLIRTNRRYAAKVAAYFWDAHNLNKYADKGDLIGATKAVNGGTNGIEDRTARHNRALAVLGISATAELERILGRRVS
jgi:putative chitinase